MSRNFKLLCGVTLQVEYVPVVYARSEASRRFPSPDKPTVKIEIAKDIFEDRETTSPEYRRALEHYNDYVWPLAVRAALIDMAVVDESLPPIDHERLAQRRSRVPREWHFTDKADWILMCLLSSTSGSESELEMLWRFIITNDFTFAEVEAAARDLKSAD